MSRRNIIRAVGLVVALFVVALVSTGAAATIGRIVPPQTAPNEAAIDPEFAPLVQVLAGKTDIPLWLPATAPRKPDAELRCSHHGLITGSPRESPGD